MKKFSLNLSLIYLVFVMVPLVGDIVLPSERKAGVQEKPVVKERPQYSVVVPESSSEVLMKREGLYVYSGRSLNLGKLSVNEKKKVFVGLLLPAIEVVEKEIEWKRERVEKLKGSDHLEGEEEEFLRELYRAYNVKDENINRLLSRMVMPPKSLILSQAALESGWGTSRFFREGNNIFGVWSYNKDEARIPAMVTRENGYTAHLKSYGDLKGSIEDYILLLSRNSNYRDFREGLRRGEDSLELAGYLTMYSELREEYVKRVRSVINSNQLKELD